MTLAIVSGFILSWAQLESLRRNTSKLLNGGNPGSGKWGMLFALRWGAFGVILWGGLHLFKADLIPFLMSFVLSGFILRLFYRRQMHAV